LPSIERHRLPLNQLHCQVDQFFAGRHGAGQALPGCGSRPARLETCCRRRRATRPCASMESECRARAHAKEVAEASSAPLLLSMNASNPSLPCLTPAANRMDRRRSPQGHLSLFLASTSAGNTFHLGVFELRDLLSRSPTLNPTFAILKELCAKTLPDASIRSL